MLFSQFSLGIQVIEFPADTIRRFLVIVAFEGYGACNAPIHCDLQQAHAVDTSWLFRHFKSPFLTGFLP